MLTSTTSSLTKAGAFLYLAPKNLRDLYKYIIDKKRKLDSYNSRSVDKRIQIGSEIGRKTNRIINDQVHSHKENATNDHIWSSINR